MMAQTPSPWPELPWTEWPATMATLHMWTQIVGKIRMALAPPLNHWWHITLYVSARGMTSSAIPYGRRSCQGDFDFIEHRLHVADSDAGRFTMPLEPKAGARLHPPVMAGLGGSGIC